MQSEQREHFTKIGGHFMGELTFCAIPRSEENAHPNAGCGARFHVAHFVADKGALGSIELKIRDRLQEHSRLRLAPRVIAAILADAVERVMRAVVEPADGYALLGKSVAHPSGQLLIGIFVEVAAADTGLVRGDNDRPSHFVGPEAAELENARNEFELIRPMDIAAINIDDAIAVEEERALRHGPCFRSNVRPTSHLRNLYALEQDIGNAGRIPKAHFGERETAALRDFNPVGHWARWALAD